MALIEFSSTPPEQKSSGGVTFLRRNGNAAMRARTRPVNRASAEQLRQRDILRRAGRAWKYDLTIGTQTNWNDCAAKINSAPIGPPYPLVRGVDWYSELILLYQTYGITNDINQDAVPPTTDMQLVQQTITYIFSTGNVELVLTSYSEITPTDTFFVYITAPRRNNNLGSWQRANFVRYQAADVIIPDSGVWDATIIFPDPYNSTRSVTDRPRVKLYSVIQNFAYYPLWWDVVIIP
jgi:hypothetical protein